MQALILLVLWLSGFPLTNLLPRFLLGGVLFNLGVSTAKLGDNKTAIRHFDEVLRLDPNLGVAYLTRCASVSHARLSPLLHTPAVSVRAARFALVIAGAAL